ncbi:MAG: DbpA RNA binding domain-containing protein, partial [Paludibacteraceae bacterium]|nr:DbpA RNA binding domain-containing protein [Paludibacteraceae bacterium]
TTRQRNAIAKIEKNIHREFRQMPIPTGEDICRRQMLHWAARLQNEPEAAQIDAWMGPVLDMLADVSKEDLLRRLMQLECGRFADYYREADDLNLLFKKTKDRSKSAKTPKDADYPALKKGKRRGDESNPNFVRLKIDRGRNDKFEPRRLLGLINDVTGDRSIVVGEIDIAPKFSFFSVPKHQVAKIYEAFAVSPKAKGIRLGDVKGERRTKNNDEIAPKRVSHRYESRGATRKK